MKTTRLYSIDFLPFPEQNKPQNWQQFNRKTSDADRLHNNNIEEDDTIRCTPDCEQLVSYEGYNYEGIAILNL